MRGRFIRFLFPLLAGWLSCPVFGQDATDYERFREASGPLSIIFQGRQSTEYGFPYNGTCYWTSPQFEEGSLCYRGKVYTGLLLNINAAEQELICSLPGSTVRGVLDGTDIDWVMMGGKKYVPAESISTATLPSGFWEVVYEGDALVVKQIRRLLRKDMDGALRARAEYDGLYRRNIHDIFIAEINYYHIAPDGTVTPLRRNRDIRNLYPDRKKELGRHMRHLESNRLLSQERYYQEAMSFVEGGLSTGKRAERVRISPSGLNDAKFFVQKGGEIHSTLPAGYFRPEADADDGTLIKYAGEQNVTTTFQNKVYEIGVQGSARKGKAAVSGTVRDAVSGEPLPGVSVYDGKGAFAETDAAGFYRILLSAGNDTLHFAGHSLEDMTFTLLVHGDGGFDVNMKEKVYSLTGAVVTSESQARHRVSQMGVEKVRINVIKNVPVAFGETDVLKVVLTLPGVKTVGEVSSGFNVRGGSTDQNLILFNDATVYNPSHMFGILSAFNSDVISDVELYKGSIPVEYGGRISSVLEVRSREGSNKKITGSAGIGLLTSRAHLEGPIGAKTTFVAGLRTTYSDWLLGLIPKESGYANGSATFQDVNLGVTHRINASNSLHLNGYLAGDRFRFTNDTSFTYRNGSLSLKWRSRFSERHSAVVAAGYTHYGYSVDDTDNEASAYRLSSNIGQSFIKSTFSLVPFSGHKLTYGASASRYDLNGGSVQPVGEGSLVTQKSLPRETAWENALYLNDSWEITPAVTFDAGIRLSHYLSVNDRKNYFGPEYRLSGKVSFTPNLSWKAGFNTMHQYLHKISNSINISPTDTWKMSDAALLPQSGWQAATGLYATVLSGQVELSMEAYFKKVDHFVDYKSGAILVMNPNLTNELVDTECRAYGVEWMVRKSLGQLNGWISYTYSRSLQRETQDRGLETINGGKWYSTSYDKPHNLVFVGNYKLTHRYSFSANLDWSTGRPVTIPVGTYLMGGTWRLLYSERNGYRIPDYFRLDLALIVEPGHYLRQLTHMSWTLGVYNVTGRRNPYSVYYTNDPNVGVRGHMLSILGTQIPYININLKF